MTKHAPSSHAASHGEPSYVWRQGQERRLAMIQDAAGELLGGSFLEVGCGIGLYLQKIGPVAQVAVGLEYEAGRARMAAQRSELIIQGAGEHLPLPTNAFDVVLSHEVIEHVSNDRAVVQEMVRSLKPGGRLILFCPNRWYPFETHGMYWRGNYVFGNIPLLNYLPRPWRDNLAPHVRAYTAQDVEQLFADLPVDIRQRSVIFGAYDNIIAKKPHLGRIIRTILQSLEGTPLRVFGLSHFWVVEKTSYG